MTIFNLEMRRLAEERALGILRQSWPLLNDWITNLENPNVEFWTAQPYDTAERKSNVVFWIQKLKQNQDFLTEWRDCFDLDIIDKYGTDYVTALDGAIESFDSIKSYLINLLKTYYWDAVNDEPRISEVSTAHREDIADDIKAEFPNGTSVGTNMSFNLTITADMTVS